MHEREREEWQRSIDSASTPELKKTRLQTYLAQIKSNAAHGGPDRQNEVDDIRRQRAELKKER